MTVWAALLRGVNVGGHNKVPMAELRAALGAEGFSDVATYIASGNIVLQAEADPTKRISEIIAKQFGLDITVIGRSGDQLRAAIEANPFADQAAADPRAVHCFFASSPTGGGAIDSFDHERYAPDRLAVGALGEAGEFYASYPNGMAKSKLTNAVVDRLAGGPTTARNWNTVLKLDEMVTAAGG